MGIEGDPLLLLFTCPKISLCSHAAQRLPLFSLFLLLSSSLSFVSSLRSINPRITPHTPPCSFHPSVPSPPTNRIFTLFLPNSFREDEGMDLHTHEEKNSVLSSPPFAFSSASPSLSVQSVGISLISGRRDSQGNESPILLCLMYPRSLSQTNE